MELERVMDALDKNIICEHKYDDFGGDFFHNHDGFELFLFISGFVNYYVEQQGRHMSPGTLICIKPYDFHRRELVRPGCYERIIINIRNSVMSSLSSDLTALSTCFYRQPDGCINLMHLKEEEMEEYIYLSHKLNKELNSKEFGGDILAESYLKQILVLVNRLTGNRRELPENIMPRLVKDVMIYVELHLTEDISLSLLAGELHHNGTYISRRFKEITGLSLQQYIIKKRITLSKNYLNEGYSPLEACFSSGFNDYSNFYRTFTKQVGLSPKKYQLNTMLPGTLPQ
ncbi:AraC family transcriptional regulator [Anaerocolumna sp. AGMB13020]|uniref:helix-turn-helix domain-containing protein n=1 Tax=Anaerocolumna sp. AGMB13020 TaxID=3081750 RepID=UPI0029544362|nr:AraC family transcriptional regulator [Anaerocolumna sp. AGMB13020]WOO38253.1 AraC family transcriptional regulator [Anaerocolumna sp. AGMB13020]